MNGKRKEALGMVAGLFTTSAYIPQIYSIWSKYPKPADDVSLAMFAIVCVGVSLWFAYGVIHRAKSIIIYNAIAFVLAASVVAYKLMYG